VVVKDPGRLSALNPDSPMHVILSLRVEVLPELDAGWDDRECDDRECDDRVDTEQHEQAVNELRRLTWVVDHAAIAEDLAGEPEVVELGKAVTVRDGQGVIEQFLIVHPVEAALDDMRISVRSPLAQALLGHRAGEEVEVAAPAGPYRCRILAVELPPGAQAGHAADRRHSSARRGRSASR
jgi:transcription elongation factor GreA